MGTECIVGYLLLLLASKNFLTFISGNRTSADTCECPRPCVSVYYEQSLSFGQLSRVNMERFISTRNSTDREKLEVHIFCLLSAVHEVLRICFGGGFFMCPFANISRHLNATETRPFH